MQFQSEVIHCEWVGDEGKWKVEIRKGFGGEAVTEYCDILLYATGIFNNTKWPEISTELTIIHLRI